ncbi:MAG: GNAT family N-acetyltransferase [Bacteroidetes bacterium]|nr:GNAT family N-acetyltransferase [Bacteroidota bacterium]
MDITIKEVNTKSDFNAFIEFPYTLYKGNPYFVPPLKFDEKATLDKTKNPAFDYCDARYWLAYKGNKVVGRIAAIHNKAYIEKWGNKYLRFGWIDFEEDINITKKLIEQVEAWAKELGMTAVHGPLGFTDLDHEGMLIEGFDQLGTLATIYNHPYYPKFMETLGYAKDTDWVEYKIFIPQVLPPSLAKMAKLAEVVQRRYKLKFVETKKTKDILPYANQIFELINETYADLYGVVPLTQKQMDVYTKQYFGFVKHNYLPLVVDENDQLVSFGVTMPSLSKALQKSNGSLFPFGFIHLLKALKKNDMVDLYLVAVKKEYQGKGVTALLMSRLLDFYRKDGVKYVESNIELEDNKSVISMFEPFERELHKRRRCYIKQLTVKS